MVPAEPHGGYVMGVVVGWSLLWDGNGEEKRVFGGEKWDGMRCGEFDIEGWIRLFPEVDVMYMLYTVS
jgi:hypothetical protein